MQNIDNKFTAENQENLNNAFRKILEHHFKQINKFLSNQINIVSVDSIVVEHISDDILKWDEFEFFILKTRLFIDSELYINVNKDLLIGSCLTENHSFNECGDFAFLMYDIFSYHFYDIIRSFSKQPENVETRFGGGFVRRESKEENDNYIYNSFQITVNLSMSDKTYKIIYFLPTEYIPDNFKIKTDDCFKSKLYNLLRKYKNDYKNLTISSLVQTKSKRLFKLIKNYESFSTAYILNFYPTNISLKTLSYFNDKKKKEVMEIMNKNINMRPYFFYDFYRIAQRRDVSKIF